jgi:hypothetical protein
MWKKLQGLAGRWEALGADPELVQALRYGIVPEFHQLPRPYDYGGLWLEGEQLQAWEALRDHYLSIDAIKLVDSLKWCKYRLVFMKRERNYICN